MRHPLAAFAVGVLLASPLPVRADDAAAAPPPAAKVPQAISGPIPIGVEADVYCSGYLGEPGEVFPGTIASAEKHRSQTMFMKGDVVYLDIGAQDGVQAGMEFTIVRPRGEVNRWGSVIEVVGRVYATPGRVLVICAQERSSIAEISYSCSDVEIGDFVKPFEPAPVPLARRTEFASICDVPNGKVTGHIVATREGETPIATASTVFLDLGEADGLNPGDFLTVFQPSAHVEGVRTILGEASILTTRNRTSVAIITRMSDTMGVGDIVELK